MFPDDGDVFGAFHVESDGGSLSIRFVNRLDDALRKSTLPRRLHCFIAKSETRHEAALRWGQVQDVPVLGLQTQTNRPLVSRSALLNVNTIFSRQTSDQLIPKRLGGAQSRSQFVIRVGGYLV